MDDLPLAATVQQFVHGKPMVNDEDLIMYPRRCSNSILVYEIGEG